MSADADTLCGAGYGERSRRRARWRLSGLKGGLVLGVGVKNILKVRFTHVHSLERLRMSGARLGTNLHQSLPNVRFRSQNCYLCPVRRVSRATGAIYVRPARTA
jgi:hypothetical protein